MFTVPKVSLTNAPSRSKGGTQQHHRHRSFLESVSEMSDEDILYASVKNANKRAENTIAARVLEKRPFIFYAATSITCGALTKGDLSKKAAAAIATLGVCGFISAASKPVGKAVDSVMNIGSKDKNRTKENPFLNTVLSVAALIGITSLAMKGANAGAAKLVQKFRPSAQELSKKIAAGARRLDKSKAGRLTKQISKRTAEFSAKHPKASSFIGKTAIYAPLAGVLGASVPLVSKIANDRNKFTDENIAKLVLYRDVASLKLENYFNPIAVFEDEFLCPV